VILPGLGMAWNCGFVLPSDECIALQYNNPEWNLNEFWRYGVSGNLCQSVCYCLPHSSCHKRFLYFSEKSVDELNKYAFRVAVVTKWCCSIC